jgi:signal transduction histidine kinase
MSKVIVRFIIILTIIIGFMSESFIQSQDNDSLIQVISRQPNNLEKADNLLKLTRYYLLRSELDSALLRCEEALELSIRLDYKTGTGDAYYLKSSIYRIKSDLNTSLNLSEKYLEIYMDLQDSVRLAKGYYNLGMLHKELSNYELALHYCRNSLLLAVPKKEFTVILGNYNCMGGTFLNGNSMVDSAAAYYLKALDITEKTNNQSYLSTILNNLGDVYFADHQYETAREYYSRSLEMNLNSGNKQILALNYVNLGRLAREEKKFTEADDFYLKGLDIFIELDDQVGIANVYNNLGDSYFLQEKFDNALPYFQKALKIYRETDYLKGIISSLLNISAVYTEQGKIEKARKLQDSCIVMAQSARKSELLLLVYQNIADNLKEDGDFEKAYDYRMKYQELYDSLFNIEKSKAINALLLKYEKGKDQARILELEKENLQRTYQRNAYMFTGLGIVVLALFLFAYFRQKARHEKIVTEQKIRQLEEEKKLMAAKLLVEGQEEERKRIATELHDGLGVLLSATRMQFSTIMDKSPENRNLIEKASRMLEQASGDVRKISHNMMPGLLTKLGFYEAAEDLFEQIDENMDLNASCTISGDQENRLPENKEIMLYRILQEWTNNTLKHAEAKNITLQITILQETLEMIYTDDGKGFDYTGKSDTDSLGLKSVQSRVDFLNGKLTADSQPGKGIRYTLQIPV